MQTRKSLPFTGPEGLMSCSNPVLTLTSCFLNEYKSSTRNLEVDNFGNLRVDGMQILRWSLNAQGVTVCDGFVCLGTGSSDKLH
jgi:hypothetical protein